MVTSESASLVKHRSISLSFFIVALALGALVVHHECVGDRTGSRASRFFDTLENQIRKNGGAPESAQRVIIKMDIEGAEWDAFLATPDELLASIPQISMEMHGYDDPKIV